MADAAHRGTRICSRALTPASCPGFLSPHRALRSMPHSICRWWRGMAEGRGEASKAGICLLQQQRVTIDAVTADVEEATGANDGADALGSDREIQEARIVRAQEDGEIRRTESV